VRKGRAQPIWTLVENIGILEQIIIKVGNEKVKAIDNKSVKE